MRNTITKLYPKLTPRERFRLVLEALARGDKEEMDRLAATCPREVYRMADAAFYDLVEASRLIAASFCIAWLDALGRYKMVETIVQGYLQTITAFVEAYVKGANAAWKQAGKEGVPFSVEGREPTEEELKEAGLAAALDRFPALLQQALRERAAELRGLWNGFTRFCLAVKVEPEKMLAWYPPVLADIEAARSILDGKAPVDEEKAECIYAMLHQAWPEELDDEAALPN